MKPSLVLLFLLVPFTAFAEPTPTVKALMTQPVSMFNYGLHLLEKRLQQEQANQGDKIIVIYSPQENKIIVHASVISTNNPIDWCKFKTKLIKYEFEHCWVYFCDYSYDAKCQSKDYQNQVTKEIKKITYIDVSVFRSIDERNDNKPSAHSIWSFNKEEFQFKE